MLDSFTRQNVIGRLRVAGTNVDALSARLRAERLLNAADLEAAQPTPSAIVFIRKLRDPLPGVLSLDSSATEPPTEWKAALTNTLRSVAGRAGRPAVEAVSGNEEAIIFADRAELLACLAADACKGATATRWWWTCLLRAGHDLDAIKKIWRESPEYIPAAMQHLSKGHMAAAFVQQLDDDTTHQFVRAITNVFGLQWLMPVVAQRVAAIEYVGPTSDSVTGPDKELPNAPPWAAQVTDAVTRQLSLEQQRFLGITLMIQQAPAVVRAREFARAVEQWQEQAVESAPIQIPRSSPQIAQSQTIQQTVISLPSVHTSPGPAFRIEEVNESPIQTTKPYAHETLTFLTTTESPESITPEVVAGPIPESAPTIIDNIVQSEPTPPDTAVASLSSELTDPSISETVELNDDTAAILIETDLGGLFYLINLGVYLNLYSDFTSPLSPGIELNLWDFVALVGNELLEGTHGDDPIWAALANLAGRDETQPPGMNFEPESEWRSPLGHSQYRNAVASGEPRSAVSDGHQRPDATALRYRPGPTLALEAKRRRSLDRWLSLLMPYLRTRLRVALGLSADDEIPDILCRHHARVRATDTHVDVYFSLADLPLAIRFAGLDRDPGWVPAAGRFISFHFD